MKISRIIALIGGICAGVLAAYSLYLSTGNLVVAKTAGVAVCMAVWWITEPISLYVTAFIPVFMFPLLGIMSADEVAPLYTNQIIFLFIGGFLIAFALEKWNLHQRIAFKIILSIGSTPSRILLGFMLASYLLSMWILNTATTLMLLPAVMAVSTQFEQQAGKNSGHSMTTPLLLGLAYAASIGGTATVIGTAPNGAFMGYFNDHFKAPRIGFANWMMFGLPLSMLLFAGCYFLLKKMFLSGWQEQITLNSSADYYIKLGKMKWQEMLLLILFIITILLWFFRTDIELGNIVVPGWSRLFPEKDWIKDSTVAMVMACLMFMIPTGRNNNMLNWEQAKKLPFGVLFLFGGGFALAKGVEVSGLGNWMADQLKGLSSLHPLVIIFCLSLFMTFFTEMTSNTASTLLMLPVIHSMSKNVDLPPVILMLPVVVSASCAFMLPVATPPNTIVFGSEKLKIHSMIRAGLVLNIMAVFVISCFVWILGGFVFAQ